MNDLEKKQKSDIIYMSMAFLAATMSRAKRAKVGAVIVKEGIVVSTGFNGLPRKTDNECEYIGEDNISHTKPEVIHAELNAILNIVISNSGTTIKDSTIFITYSPCICCASLIKQVGIKRVVYCHKYRLDDGIKFLERFGIEVEQIKETELLKNFKPFTNELPR